MMAHSRARDCKALMRGLRLRRHGIRLLAARSWSAGRRRNDPQARDESRVAALLVAVRHRSRRASRVDGALDVSVLDDGPAAGRRRPVPIWIGGHTDAAVRRAATLGDAWHPIALRPPGLLFPDEYAKRAKELGAWAQQAGRDPKSIELTVRVPMEVRPKNAKPPAGERPLFQGTAAEVVADIRAYQAAGVTHFVFDPTVPELKAALTNMDRFAHDVRGSVEKPGRSHPASRTGRRPVRAR